MILLFCIVNSIALAKSPGGPPTVAQVTVDRRAFFEPVEISLGKGTVVFVEVNYSTYAPLFFNTFTTTQDTAIGLYDFDGNLLAENDDIFGGPSSEIRTSELDAGIYYLAVGIDDVTFGHNFDVVSNSTSAAKFSVRIGTLPYFITGPIRLEYNFNGIVHPGEGLDADAENGFRSISDRALDFRNGIPNLPIFDEYGISKHSDELDIIHLGNRNSVYGGLFAFDDAIDGDCLGIQPSWLTNAEQQTTFPTLIPDYQFVSHGSHLGILYQIDGGGSFDVVMEFCFSDFVFRQTITGPDWRGGEPNIGNFPGTVDSDCASMDPSGKNDLTISEAIVDLSNLQQDEFFNEYYPRTISFELNEGTEAVAILGISIGFAGVADVFDQGDFNFDGVVDILDVAPFVEIIVSGDLNLQADINRDCLVNLLDIEPFIQLLLGN